MNFKEIFSTAQIAILANKGRSLLTMLGVIIGVTAVILLVALGKGVENYVTDQFEALGSNLLFVSPGNADFSNDPSFSYSRNKFEEKHVDLLKRSSIGDNIEVAPRVAVGGTASYKNKSYYVNVIGTSSNFDKITNFELEQGRIFTSTEVSSKREVAIVGYLIAQELFGNENPIGKRITLEEEKFEIIGVLTQKGQNFDEVIVAPYTTIMSVFDIDNFSSIGIKPDVSIQSVDSYRTVIERTLLRDLHEDDFSVLSQGDLLDTIQGILGVLTLGLGAIAGISLIVGGIGIMNIMLVAVTERIREIGLRKAVGATSTDIAAQFIMESLLLSMSGGLIGIALGWLGSLAARSFLRTEVTWWAVALAFSFSVLVGIIFGTYPAVKASKEDPINALRYE